MNRFESLMVAYPELSYEFDNNMPAKQGGYIFGGTVYINGNRDYPLQVESLAEELAHYKVSPDKDILDLSDPSNAKEEHIARQASYTLAIQLDDLIACNNVNINTPQELADYFEVSIEFLWKTIEAYRTKYGLYFEHKGYVFDLRTGLNIRKKEK